MILRAKLLKVLGMEHLVLGSRILFNMLIGLPVVQLKTQQRNLMESQL